MISTIASPVRQNGSGHEHQKNNRKIVSKNFLILFAITTLFLSCTKDDEVPPSIIGKWEFYTGITFDASNNPNPEVNYNQYPNCKKCFLINNQNNTSIYGSYLPDCKLQEQISLLILMGKNLIIRWQ